MKEYNSLKLIKIMHLANLQKLFFKNLNFPTTDADFDSLKNVIKPALNINNKTAIDIYRNNVTSSRTKALIEIYPICKKIVGEDYFNQLTYKYISQYPSTSHDLNKEGSTLPIYLSTLIEARPELKELLYLPDLAQLEQYWNQSFYAPDDEKFDFNAFSQLPESLQPIIRFNISHSLYSLKSPYPIYKIWAQNRNNENKENLHIKKQAEALVIIRTQFEPKIYQVDQDLYNLITSIKKGKNFSNLIEEAPNSVAQEQRSNWILDMIKKHWISGFTTSPDTKLGQ